MSLYHGTGLGLDSCFFFFSLQLSFPPTCDRRTTAPSMIMFAAGISFFCFFYLSSGWCFAISSCFPYPRFFSFFVFNGNRCVWRIRLILRPSLKIFRPPDHSPLPLSSPRAAVRCDHLPCSFLGPFLCLFPGLPYPPDLWRLRDSVSFLTGRCYVMILGFFRF